MLFTQSIAKMNFQGMQHSAIDCVIFATPASPSGQDSRTTSSGGMNTDGVSSPAILRKSSSTMVRAPAAKSCRMVVKAGEPCLASAISSKPTTETSPGVERPAAARAWIAVMAIKSEAAKMPSNRAPLSISVWTVVWAVSAVKCAGAFGVRAEPRLRQGLEISLPTQIRLRRARRSEKGDALAALPDQVLNGHSGAGYIVGPHGAVVAPADLSAPDHERPVGFSGVVERLVLIALPDDQQAIGPLRLNDAGQPPRPGRDDLLEENLVASPRDLVGEVADHLQKERIADKLSTFVTKGHDQADHMRALQAKASRGLVDDVAMLLGQRGDLLAQAQRNGGMS